LIIVVELYEILPSCSLNRVFVQEVGSFVEFYNLKVW